MRATIDKLRQAGYLVELDGESVVWRFAGIGQPNPDVVRPLLADLSQCKSEAFSLLEVEREEDRQEGFEERAAILEYDGEMDRAEAEQVASEGGDE